MDSVTLADAKSWLRVDHDDDNDLIAELIAAAERRVENYTGLAFATADDDATLRTAVKLVLGVFYESRGADAEIRRGILNLLDQYRTITP